MGVIDIALLLEPLAGNDPAGEDLEYDQQFTDLALLAQVTPDKVVLVKNPDDPDGKPIERVTPGSQPDPKVVLTKALGLFDRTKDLRVAMYVVYGATCIEGLTGLEIGTSLIVNLLEKYWSEVYPRLDPEDGMDPIIRINVLNGFSDPLFLFGAIRNCPLAEARAIGKFSLRDIDVINGNASPIDGQTAATPDLLRATIELDSEQLGVRISACIQILENFSKITSIFRDRNSATPALDSPIKIVKQALTMYKEVNKMIGSSASGEASADSISEGEGRPKEYSTGNKLSSRKDAKSLLEQICQYLEQTEPAHPSPLLLRRAIRLLDMNFLDIMRELNPESVSEIERLGGIKKED